MELTRHINPDHYLETDAGLVFTTERNKLVWEQAHADLAQALRATAPPRTLYVVMGVQGAGKTTWGESNQSLLANAMVFDAALPAKAHRVKLLAMAVELGTLALAVFINTGLALALARNQLRSPDKQVPEAAVRHVFSMLEPPSPEEGFSRIIEVLADNP